MSDDIPHDEEHLAGIEEAVKAYQNDPVIITEAIEQMIDEVDMNNLFTNPLAFGERMQEKVLEYIRSTVEEERK